MLPIERRLPEHMPIKGIARRCPVCASADAETLFENRMAPCAGYDFSTPILRCRSCDSAYAGSALRARDLNRYYSSLSKYDTLKSRSDVSALDRERALLATGFLAPNLSSITNVLDVGCSTGVLLHALRQAGVNDVRGIDPAGDSSTVARALFDVTVTQAQAETYAHYGIHDLVCLMAVLEHLLEPRRLLLEIGAQLKPGGRVLIEVPDAGAFDRPGDDRAIEPFGEFSNEHINFLSITDVQRLAHAAGLEVERWKTLRIAGGFPDLFVLLRRGGMASELPAPDAGSDPSHSSSGESVRDYVVRSKLAMADIARRLEAPCRGPTLIYGAGNHTGRLLMQSPALAAASKLAVFDRNHHLQGETIGGIPIVSPTRLAEYPTCPIIISTFNARNEIANALSAVTSQTLVLLYD